MTYRKVWKHDNDDGRKYVHFQGDHGSRRALLPNYLRHTGGGAL